MKRLYLWMIAAVVLLTGCQRDISGTYLAIDNATVCWLQLVRTPDNHLTGQFDVSVLNPDGSVNRNSVAIMGAVDGENVTLSASRFFGLQTVTFSGTLQGNRLTLTGLEPKPFILQRSTLSDYQAQIAQLDARSQSIIAVKAVAQSRQRMEQAQKNVVAQIDQLVANLQRFDLEADVHLGRFPNAEKGYQAITAKVAAYVERERQLASNPNAGVARSQLVVDATQASLATDQLHYQGQSLQSTLEMNVKPMAGEVTTYEERCREVAPNELTPIESDAHSAACSRLAAAAVPFREKYNAVVAGLAHLDQVYTQERNSQQRLLQSAERLQ